MISEYEAERWRQLSDELSGQVERLGTLTRGQTVLSKAEWQAIEAIGAASRQLFSAFASIMREKEDA